MADELLMRSRLSKLDMEHNDKVKIAIKNDNILHPEKGNCSVIYCSLCGCDEIFRPCTRSQMCPYQTIKCARDQKENDLQNALLAFKDVMRRCGNVRSFMNGDYDEADGEFMRGLIDTLSKEATGNELIQASNHHLVIRQAYKKLKENSKKFWDEREFSTPKFKYIGEYIMVEIDGLPRFKQWHKVGFGYAWIKLSDINEEFIQLLKTFHPDYGTHQTEKIVAYRRNIEALLKQLDEKFELSTMLKLENSI